MDVPLFLLGDSAYPLQTRLMKPYPDSSAMTSEQKMYNYRTSRARIVIENAFGRLKGRWRRLIKKNDMSVGNVPCVIAACCILHNLCEIHGDSFDNTWVTEEDQLSQPTSIPTTCTSTTNRAKLIRIALLHFFQTH